MSIQRIDNVGIAVRDLRATIRFFEALVGLKVTPATEATPPSATVHVGDQYLYVFETTGPPGTTRSPDLVGNPSGIDHVSLTVSDIDAEHAEMTRRGVSFSGEPSDVDEWGLRMVSFTDPDGNLFYLVQPL